MYRLELHVCMYVCMIVFLACSQSNRRGNLTRPGKGPETPMCWISPCSISSTFSKYWLCMYV